MWTCDGKEETVQVVECRQSGTAQVASPTVTLPPSIGPIQGSSCMGLSGLCDRAATVLFATEAASGGPFSRCGSKRRQA
jgi:hypothetical protein